MTATALLVAGLVVSIGASHIQNPAAASAARFGNHPWVRLTDGWLTRWWIWQMAQITQRERRARQADGSMVESTGDMQ